MHYYGRKIYTERYSSSGSYLGLAGNRIERIDVVQVSMPARLNAPPPPVSQPRLHNRGTLIWQDHGANKFDTT